jgi:hypothetical protein
MVNQNLYNVIDEMTEIGRQAESTFGHLSAEQINWNPSADGWSVGQCFEHLIKSNELFYDDLERIASGDAKILFSKIIRRSVHFSALAD